MNVTNCVSRGVRRLAAVTCVTFLLAACGGGGGGGGGDRTPPTTPPTTGGPSDPPTTGGPGGPSDPPTTGPSVEDLASAQNARLRMSLNSPQLMVSWIDTFDNESGYEVQRRIGTGEWQVVEALPRLDGGTTQWQRNVDATATYRVVAKVGDYSLPLYAAPDESEITVDLDISTWPTVQIDQTEPVHGDLQVSLQNAAGARGVVYLLDFSQFAYVTSGGSFTATLPAAQLLNGPRNLLAIVQKTAGYAIWRGRRIESDNLRPAVILLTTSSNSSMQPITLLAKATAASGIAAVEFFANGNAIGVDTTPDVTGTWLVQVSAGSVPSGTNTFRAVATDNNGATVSMERQITVDNVPSLQVEGPFDGMISNGPINVRGEFGDDLNGAVLSITLGARSLARTTVSPFNIDASLDGVTPGEHSLMVRVQDTNGKVTRTSYQVIVPPTALTYELVATDAQALLAVDNGTLLYRNNSGGVTLKNANGSETELEVPSSLTINQWWLHDGHVAALNAGNSNVYGFVEPNQPVNVSAQTGTLPVGLVQRGPWLTWRVSGQPQFNVYNLRTGVSTQVMDPAMSATMSFDFIATPGSERLLFATHVSGGGGLYSHALATGTTTQLGTGMYHMLQTDGTSLAWRDGVALAFAPLSNLTATRTFSPGGLQRVDLDAGRLYLLYDTGNYSVDDGAATTVISPNGVSSFTQSVRDGRAVFSESFKLHTWSPAGGKRIVLDTVPAQVLHADGVAYLRTGNTGTLYRVTLP